MVRSQGSLAAGGGRRRLSPGESGGEALREKVRSKDMEARRADLRRAGGPRARRGVQRSCSSPCKTTPKSTARCCPIARGTCWRMIGLEHAHTLLRQSVHYCVKSEREWKHTPEMRQAARAFAQAARPVPVWSANRWARGRSTTRGSIA